MTSKKQVYINEIKILTDSALNDGASLSIWIENQTEEKINRILVHDYHLNNVAEHVFDFSDHPIFFKEDETMEVVYAHHEGSERKVYITRKEFYIPFNTYR